MAAHGPPSLISAAAATAEQSMDNTTPVIAIGTPSSRPARRMTGRAGKKAIRMPRGSA
jgi:hypothetical protein